MEGNYYEKYMKELAGIMLAVELSSLKPFVPDYFGQHQLDARDLVSRCDSCQRFVPKPYAPATDLMPIPLAWPFVQWGLDQVGPLQKSSSGNHTFLLVAVEQIHQMDRGRTRHQSNCHYRGQFLQRHHMPFWCAPQHPH